METRTFSHPAEAGVVAIDPEGRYLAVALKKVGRRIMVWDVRTGELVIKLNPPGNADAIVFSPDGRHLAVGIDANAKEGPGVWVWEVGSWRAREFAAAVPPRRQSSAAGCLAFSPDGRYLAAGSAPLLDPGGVDIYDFDQGTVAQQIFLESLVSFDP